MFEIAPNPFLDSICTIVIYTVAFYNYIQMKNNKAGTGYFLLIILIVSYSLFYKPIGGDFWHYFDEYQGLGHRHMEDFYYLLIDYIPNNYLLWRLVIWLPAALFIVGVFRLMKIPSSMATVFFIVFGLASYYYTRNALALSLLYFGMAVFCLHGGGSKSSIVIKYTKKTTGAVVFLFLSLASWYLHRSMPLYITLALVALFLPFNKKYITASLIAFPLLYGAVMLISSNFLNVAEIWLSEGTGVNYLESENEVYATWKGIISLIFHYAPVFYFYYIAFKQPISKDDDDFQLYKSFLLLSFFITIISFLFYGQGSSSIQGRLYKSALIPLSMTVALYFKHFNNTKRTNTFVYLVFLSYAWSLFVGLVTGK